MKAFFMKVNYDPKYLTPHLSTNKSQNNTIHSSSTQLSSRFSLTKQIYTPNNILDKKSHERIQQKARERFQQTLDELKTSTGSSQTAIVKLPTTNAWTYDGKEKTASKNNTALINLKSPSTGKVENEKALASDTQSDNKTSHYVRLHDDYHQHRIQQLAQNSQEATATAYTSSKPNPFKQQLARSKTHQVTSTSVSTDQSTKQPNSISNGNTSKLNSNSSHLLAKSSNAVSQSSYSPDQTSHSPSNPTYKYGLKTSRTSDPPAVLSVSKPQRNTEVSNASTSMPVINPVKTSFQFAPRQSDNAKNASVVSASPKKNTEAASNVSKTFSLFTPLKSNIKRPSSTIDQKNNEDTLPADSIPSNKLGNQSGKLAVEKERDSSPFNRVQSANGGTPDLSEQTDAFGADAQVADEDQSSQPHNFNNPVVQSTKYSSDNPVVQPTRHSITIGTPAKPQASSEILPHRKNKTPTGPDNSEPKPSDVKSHVIHEQERRARQEAEKAAKAGKVFMCMGPYPSLRSSLRRRGWVEKFNVSTTNENAVTIPKSALTEGNEQPLNMKESSKLAVMSYVVRSVTPTFMFSVKTVDVTSKSTKSNQLVNHFAKANTFTTKAGLSQSLRSVPWFQNINSDSFYPRCYNLGEYEDKQAFIDDFNLTACINFIKYFIMKHGSESHRKLSSAVSNTSAALRIQRKSSASPSTAKDPKKQSDPAKFAFVRQNSNESNNSGTEGNMVEPDVVPPAVSSKMFSKKRLSVKSLRFAIARCRQYLTDMEHGDIDTKEEKGISQEEWNQFLEASKMFISNELDIDKRSYSLVPEAKEVHNLLKDSWPQFELDGIQNVWILKPGAKSRGRGIQCVNTLPAILDAISSSDCALVAQKYIERPLLVYKVKFDIRQWFLVTDWNPLTMWFYSDCYLRFCSREYTLEDFHVAIHLSNNSVQKYYLPSSERSPLLPDDNMWTSDEFQDYLRAQGQGEIWQTKVVPGMKEAILCVLLCTQDQVEQRKGSFELFGADFMLTEDMQPWLIEINSSPSMAKTTRATALLVDGVLEDTVKVVLDRKTEKNCDTGRFELAYKQQFINDPPPLEISLSVEGRKIKTFGANR